MRALACLLAAVLVAATAAGARAGAGALPDEPQLDSALGARAVLYRPKDADRRAWGRGVATRLRLGESSMLEGSGDWINYVSGGAPVREVPLQASLLDYYLIPGSPLAFYGLVGYGWYLRKQGGPAAHSETLSHPHAGAGAQVRVSDRLSFDLSWRFLWSAVWRLTDYSHPWGTNYSARGSMLTLGASYLF